MFNLRILWSDKFFVDALYNGMDIYQMFCWGENLYYKNRYSVILTQNYKQKRRKSACILTRVKWCFRTTEILVIVKQEFTSPPLFKPLDSPIPLYIRLRHNNFKNVGEWKHAMLSLILVPITHGKFSRLIFLINVSDRKCCSFLSSPSSYVFSTIIILMILN